MPSKGRCGLQGGPQHKLCWLTFRVFPSWLISHSMERSQWRYRLLRCCLHSLRYFLGHSTNTPCRYGCPKGPSHLGQAGAGVKALLFSSSQASEEEQHKQVLRPLLMQSAILCCWSEVSSRSPAWGPQQGQPQRAAQSEARTTQNAGPTRQF